MTELPRTEDLSLEEEIEEEYEGHLDLEDIKFEEGQAIGLEEHEPEEARQKISAIARSTLDDKEGEEYTADQPDEETIGKEEMEEEGEAETHDEKICAVGSGTKVRCKKYWWRTTRHNLDDDFDLPDDLEKANVKLQAILVEELKKRNIYAKRIENYFSSNETTIPSGLSKPFNPKELQNEYYDELTDLKEILNTFSDTYDDFNFKLTKLMRRCNETENLRTFFVDASRKILTEAQKKVDKSELDLLTKKRGLEPIVNGIFKCEDRVGDLMVDKALLALNMKQTKYLLGSGTVEEEVDVLQLAELKRQVNTSTDLTRLQEEHVEKMQKIVSQATTKMAFKLHHLRYEEELKETVTKDISKMISHKYNERKDVLKKIEKKALLGKNQSIRHAKTKLQNIEQYFKI